MRRALSGGALLLLLAVGGCGPAQADYLIAEQVRLMNQLADAIEDDQSDAETARARVQELRDRLAENDRKLQALTLSEEQKKSLRDKHRSELESAARRLEEATAKRPAPPKAQEERQ